MRNPFQYTSLIFSVFCLFACLFLSFLQCVYLIVLNTWLYQPVSLAAWSWFRFTLTVTDPSLPNSGPAAILSAVPGLPILQDPEAVPDSAIPYFHSLYSTAFSIDYGIFCISSYLYPNSISCRVHSTKLASETINIGTVMTLLPSLGKFKNIWRKNQ